MLRSIGPLDIKLARKEIIDTYVRTDAVYDNNRYFFRRKKNKNSKVHTLNPFAMQLIIVYNHLWKNICTLALLNPVLYAHVSLFERKQIYVIKGPLCSILKRLTSINKNIPALIISIVLQKHYCHGICAFSKKTSLIFHDINN